MIFRNLTPNVKVAATNFDIISKKNSEGQIRDNVCYFNYDKSQIVNLDKNQWNERMKSIKMWWTQYE